MGVVCATTVFWMSYQSKSKTTRRLVIVEEGMVCVVDGKGWVRLRVRKEGRKEWRTSTRSGESVKDGAKRGKEKERVKKR